MIRLSAILLAFLTVSTACTTELDSARDHINAMEYTQAIGDIQKHLAKHSDDVAARQLLARTYAWDNQYAKAEQVYDELLKKESDNTQYQFGKAQALIWQNKHSDAIPLLDGIIKHVPEEPEPWQLLILALQQSSKPADQQRVRELTKQAKARFPKMRWELIGQ